MKRLVVFTILAAFVLGCVGTAAAVELKLKGDWKINATWRDKWNFLNAEDAGNNPDDFAIWQRARNTFDFAASDNLTGVLRTEIGNTNWGNPGTFAIGNDPVAIKVARAYVQFRWPDTNLYVTAGKQPITLPNTGAIGSPILDTDATALVLSNQFTEMVGATVGFVRAMDVNATDDGTTSYNDEYDIVFGALPLTFDGISLTPFIGYGWLGKDIAGTTKDANPFFFGAAFSMTMFDPIVIDADYNYSAIGTDSDDDASDIRGWVADLQVSYTGLDMMIPRLLGWYGTGNDDDATDGSESIYDIAGDPYQTTFWFDGSAALSGNLANPVAGTWGLALKIDDLTFIDKLTHDIQIAYIKGTHDKNAPGLTFGQDLTEEDSAWEINFNTQYQIYEELTAFLELGWIAPNYDKDVWANGDKEKDAYKAALGVKYAF